MCCSKDSKTSARYVYKELDQNKVLIDDIQADQKKLSKDIRYVNNTMKAVLVKMREPNKLCIDITFMAIICMMLGVFFYIGMKYFKTIGMQTIETVVAPDGNAANGP